MEVRAILRGIFLTVLLCALALGFAACGGRKQPSAASLQSSDGSGGLQAADSLDDTLAELNALETPDGVDPALFEELKDALAEALNDPCRAGIYPRRSATGMYDCGHKWPPYSEGIKLASSPPTGASNRIDDLACSLSDGEYVLSWLYRNSGDYDQNGAVGISDITPLAIHFGEEVPEGDSERNSIQAVVDGSGNNVVDIADITPIAMHFGANVHYYSVQGSHFFSSQFTEVSQLEFPENAPNDTRLEIQHPIGAEPEYLYWRIVPVDDEGNPGDASNTTEVSAAPPPPVRILSVNPLGGVTGTEITFSAVISGEAPFDYEWNFGGGASPNESTEASPTVTLGAVDVYDASLSVENADGSAVKHFMLTVTETPGEPPQIISVSPIEGDSGTEVTFTAEVTGDGPFTYHWDFGGGASPNQSSGVSDQPSATVTLSRGGTLPEPVVTYPASLTVVNPFGMSTHDFNLSISARWHIEQIPLVPGHDEIWSASYFFGPDGNLWGKQTYLVNLVGKTFLVRVAEGNLAEYEELFGTFAVDKLGNPARLFAKETGFMSSDLYFSRKIDGTWQEESYITDRAYGTNCQLLFDSQNRPVIVYSRRLSFSPDSSDLWAAKRVSGEWELTEVRGAGPTFSYHAILDQEDQVQIIYNSWEEGGVFFFQEDAGEWTRKVLFYNSEPDDEGYSYNASAMTTFENTSTLVLFSRYDRLTQDTLIFVGTESNSEWDFEDVCTQPSSVGIFQGKDMIAGPDGLTTVFLHLYETDVVKFYWNLESSWREGEAFVWDSNGKFDAFVSPGGEPVLISKDEMATYW